MVYDRRINSIDLTPPQPIWMRVQSLMQFLMYKPLANEIDLKTFKTGIDVLLPHRRKDEDIGYI